MVNEMASKSPRFPQEGIHSVEVSHEMSCHTIQRDDLLRQLSMESDLCDICIFAGDAEQVVFDGKTLKNVKFIQSESRELKQCSFDGAILSSCIFDGNCLKDCSFRNATVNSTSFVKCELRTCIFDRAFLRDVYFTHAKLSQYTRFREADMEWIDFRYVKSDGVTFQDATMKGCDFYRAEFLSVNIFDDSKIMDASFFKTKFEGSGIRKDNLYYGILQENEQRYREYHDSWATKVQELGLPRPIGSGILQEDVENFEIYHNKWAGLRQEKDNTYTLGGKQINYFVLARFWEAMQVYRHLHAAWASSGFLRDAAWAYVKLKRLETKSYWPKYAWVIHAHRVPQSLCKNQHSRALNKIGNQEDREYFQRCYERYEDRPLFHLKDNLQRDQVVALREIFVFYKLSPMYSWRTRFGKLPNLVGNIIVDAICGFGENLPRIFLSIIALVLLPAVCTLVLESLEASDSRSLQMIDHILFSIRNLTLRDTDGVKVHGVARLLMEVQSVVGIALVGLFGFVLGNVIRNR